MFSVRLTAPRSTVLLCILLFIWRRQVPMSVSACGIPLRPQSCSIFAPERSPIYYCSRSLHLSPTLTQAESLLWFRTKAGFGCFFKGERTWTPTMRWHMWLFIYFYMTISRGSIPDWGIKRRQKASSILAYFLFIIWPGSLFLILYYHYSAWCLAATGWKSYLDCDFYEPYLDTTPPAKLHLSCCWFYFTTYFITSILNVRRCSAAVERGAVR